jgi:hypothetical protein
MCVVESAQKCGDRPAFSLGVSLFGLTAKIFLFFVPLFGQLIVKRAPQRNIILNSCRVGSVYGCSVFLPPSPRAPQWTEGIQRRLADRQAPFQSIRSFLT